MTIPKIIHQTWKTTEIPEQWKSSVQKYQALSAHGFQYILWTDDDNRNLIATEFPWFLDQFDAYPYGIQRADAIRYFILYKYGGIYSDLDIQPKDNFPAFVDMYQHADICLPSTKSGNAFAGQNFSNCFMMSSPECDFWPLVWKRLQDPFRKRGWKKFLANFHYFKILFTTGPGIISDTAAEYDKPVVAIPAQLIQPGTEKDKIPVQRPESVVELLRGESWQKKDAGFWRALSVAGNNSSTILIVLASLFFVLTIVFLYLWIRCRRNCKKHTFTTNHNNIKYT